MKHDIKSLIKKYLWVLIILIPLAILIAAFFLLRNSIRKTNYVADEDVEILTEVLETEKQLHAADIYHLEEVTGASDAQITDTWTLLVIGSKSDDAVSETGTDTETAASEGAAGKGTSGQDAVSEKSAGEEPVSQEPVSEEPVSQEAVNEEPVSEEPVSEEPVSQEASCIILMTINHPMRKVFFYTFHTELYADVEGFGGHRLASAYAAGGGPLLVSTIEKNYGVHIDQYAAIRMDKVAEILQMDEFSDLNLNEQGVDVIENLVYSMKDIAPTQMVSYVTKLLPYVTHNLTDTDLMKMIFQIPSVVQYNSIKGVLPYDGMYQDLDGYLVPDIGPTSERLKSSIYAKPENETGAESESAQS